MASSIVLMAKSKYDNLKTSPPLYDTDDPTRVQVLLYVSSIEAVNEVSLDYTVGILLHLRWHDKRLTSSDIENRFNSIKEHYVDFDSENIKEIWVPDIFFPNEKRGSFHKIMAQNQMMLVYKDGTVLYISRLSMTLSCPMDLKNYPFDKQICLIKMMSFGYTDTDVQFEWFKENSTHQDGELSASSIIVDHQVMLPQFEIKDVRPVVCGRQYHQRKGNHSCLQAEFHLARNIGFYMVQMYIPSVLIVMLSWISFWLNVNSVPGRVSLGLLTVLTMTTQSSNVNAALPRVSYTKAIDVWMSTCLVFVVAALVEFAVVNVLSRKDAMQGFSINKFFKRSKEAAKEGGSAIEAEKEDKPLNKTEATSTFNGCQETELPNKKMFFGKHGRVYAQYVDVTARLLFPVCFSVFIMSYWLHYVNAE
ncbi:glycine receptor subunit alpha-2-like [Physella acuta]|uniref:glycine receptor subunit alpha-2-like n=1 Tax=Physella acuta TaxID=109671 RepID=UPI0027DB475A|nr:glycine receptor subunit alpha-2-like [Physella acuta]